MLYDNNSEKLVGLQELDIKNVEEKDGITIIYAEIYRKEQVCPCCSKKTNTIHDYRTQKIKDIPAFGNHTIVQLRKRRYHCTACRKHFFEKNDWLPRYHRMTNRLSAYIIDKLREVRTFTSVSREVNLSKTTVIRIFNLVSYSNQSLPEVIGIDEFKGNTEININALSRTSKTVAFLMFYQLDTSMNYIAISRILSEPVLLIL